MHLSVRVYVCALYAGHTLTSEKLRSVSKGDRAFGYSSSNISNDEII